MTNPDWTELREKAEAIKFALSAYTSSDSKLMDCDLDDAAKDVLSDLGRAGFVVVKQGAQFKALLSERDELAGEAKRFREAVEMVHADYCKNKHYISAETGYVLGGLVCEDETQPIPDPLGDLRARNEELSGALGKIEHTGNYGVNDPAQALLECEKIAAEALRNARTGEGGDDA